MRHVATVDRCQDEVQAEEKSLRRLMLTVPPQGKAVLAKAALLWIGHEEILVPAHIHLLDRNWDFSTGLTINRLRCKINSMGFIHPISIAYPVFPVLS